MVSRSAARCAWVLAAGAVIPPCVGAAVTYGVLGDDAGDVVHRAVLAAYALVVAAVHAATWVATARLAAAPASSSTMAWPAQALAGLRFLVWCGLAVGFFYRPLRQPLVAVAAAIVDAGATAAALVVVVGAACGAVPARTVVVAAGQAVLRVGLALAPLWWGRLAPALHVTLAIGAGVVVASEFVRAGRRWAASA